MCTNHFKANKKRLILIIIIKKDEKKSPALKYLIFNLHVKSLKERKKKRIEHNAISCRRADTMKKVTIITIFIREVMLK